MENHVSFPFMFEVPCAKNLEKRENNPGEKEDVSMHKVKGHAVTSFDVRAHVSELRDVGLKIVL